MITVSSPDKIRTVCFDYKKAGKKIGLVPTMGALHNGHAALIEQAESKCDIVVVSIFVNPIQFNQEDDLNKYPRTLEADKALLEELGCDYLFAPEKDRFYTTLPKIRIDFGSMEQTMEGKFRPGHFNGVAIVVAKLLNLVNPDFAFFGMKDLQQFLIVKRLVKDLSIFTEIVGVTTIREQSGLALSSRNQRLSEAGKIIASQIYAGLNLMKEQVSRGVGYETVIKEGRKFFDQAQGLDLEYLEIVDAESFEFPDVHLSHEVAICVAAYVEGIRLIDNLYLRQD